jgi:hypothetical protein
MAVMATSFRAFASGQYLVIFLGAPFLFGRCHTHVPHGHKFRNFHHAIHREHLVRSAQMGVSIKSPHCCTNHAISAAANA